MPLAIAEALPVTESENVAVGSAEVVKNTVGERLAVPLEVAVCVSCATPSGKNAATTRRAINKRILLSKDVRNTTLG